MEELKPIKIMYLNTSFVGTVGSTPKVETNKDNDPYLHFRLAVDCRRNREPLWMTVYVHDHMLFNRVTKLNIDKGDRIYINGRLGLEGDDIKATLSCHDFELIPSTRPNSKNKTADTPTETETI